MPQSSMVDTYFDADKPRYKKPHQIKYACEQLLLMCRDDADPKWKQMLEHTIERVDKGLKVPWQHVYAINKDYCNMVLGQKIRGAAAPR